MPAEIFDHRGLAQDNLTDGPIQNIQAQLAAGFTGAQGPVPTVTGTTGITGAALVGTIRRGTITFGESSAVAPSTALLTVAFGVTLAAAPQVVLLTPLGPSTGFALSSPYLASGSSTGFVVGTAATGATGGGVTSYALNYLVES